MSDKIKVVGYAKKVTYTDGIEYRNFSPDQFFDFSLYLLKNTNMKKNTIDYFIAKAILKHENKYDYSLVDYINSHTKIKIICTTHGEFEQRPYRHLVGDGCPKCSGRNKTIEEFISTCRNKHENKYNYSLISIDDIKKDLKTKIICPIHGEFEQKVSSHLFGKGCSKCGGSEKMNNKNFIAKAILKHENKYDYSLVNYINNKNKVKIICTTHGEFEQRPDHHLKGQGCPICKESKGEQAISKYLRLNNILFKKQYKFKDCFNKKRLPFDFYLPEYNICIEYDGRQHYEPINRFGGEKGFNIIKMSDKIKNEYCKKNNIKLIRISYKKDVDEILKEKINGK